MPDNAIGISGKLWGGGGGGGGARAYGGGGLYRGSASAGGGGAGGYTDFSVALPGERYTIVVGNGGDGGGIVSNEAVNGISGIPSTVTDGINAYTGNHGVGGYASNISANTQVRSEGGSGGLGGGLNGTSGEHGGAGSYSKSGIFDIQWNATGGYGGGNPNGGGNTITGQATASTGASTSTDKRDGPSGFWPSGGGGGAVAIGGTSTATAIGGKGANGKVELQFSLPVPILSVDANPCSGGEVAVEVDNWETVGCVYSISANNGATWSTFDLDTHKAMLTMPLVTSAQNVTITVTATYSISAPGAVSIFPSATVVLTSTDVVTVHPGPVVTAADVTVCDNSTASFTPIVSGGETDLTYSWVCTSHSGITCAASGTGTSFGALILNQDVIDGIPSAGGEASRDATYIVTPVSSAGCLGAPFTVTVTVNTSAPGLRWDLFDGCPFDQSNAYDSGEGDKIYVWKYREKIPTGVGSDNLWAGAGGSTRKQDVRISNSDYYNAAYDPTNAADRANNPLLQDYLKGIATNTNHWAPDTMNVANYMSNLIRWDYLVKHSSLPDTSDPEFYDRTLIGSASPFSGIKWYDYNGGVFNPGMLIRNGGEYTADSRLQDFYQNKPHAEEAYWVTVTSPDGCESQPMVVTVHLLDVGESQLIEPLIGYAQLPEANNIIDIAEYLEHVDDGITFIEYYEDFTKAEDAYYSNQPYGDASIDDMAEPQIDKTIPTVGNVPGDEYRFWITKVDNTTNCRTYPAEVVILALLDQTGFVQKRQHFRNSPVIDVHAHQGGQVGILPHQPGGRLAHHIDRPDGAQLAGQAPGFDHLHQGVHIGLGQRFFVPHLIQQRIHGQLFGRVHAAAQQHGRGRRQNHARQKHPNIFRHKKTPSPVVYIMWPENSRNGVMYRIGRRPRRGGFSALFFGSLPRCAWSAPTFPWPPAFCHRAPGVWKRSVHPSS